MDLINRGTSLLLPNKFGYLCSETSLSYKGTRQKENNKGSLEMNIYLKQQTRHPECAIVSKNSFCGTDRGESTRNVVFILRKYRFQAEQE